MALPAIISKILGGSGIGDIIKGIGDIIDSLHTSAEEKLQLKTKLTELYIGLATKALDYEARIQEAATSVIKAEAQGGSWIQRSWRPILMLVFGGLIVSRWLGYSAPGISENLELELFSIVKIGLGGYIVGRSAEKIIPNAISTLKSKDNI